MSTLIIDGGEKLHGAIAVGAAKNSAVAILCATLILRTKVRLNNVPRIQDVDRIIEILLSIGVEAVWIDKNCLCLDTSGSLVLENLNKEACGKIRSTLLLLGALCGREKKYLLPKPEGCKLGERTVSPHIFALKKFGVNIVSKKEFYEVENNLTSPENKPDLRRVVMYESGDTPTENAIMVAVVSSGKTRITFASANYMVQDLCYFLRAAGADINGIGTTTLTINGGDKFKQNVEYTIMPDPIEAMTFISLAISTHSPLTIKDCPLDFLELELEKLSVMGQKFSILNERISVNGFFRIGDIRLRASELRALPDKLYGRPYPGLNIDHVPLFIPILTQAKGRSLVHDWVYENRAIYYLDMQKLGAQMVLLDPHRIFVEGKTKLRPNELMCPPAIRPAVAILITMLSAKGRSILRNSSVIERGYEELPARLRSIGAKISSE